MSNARTLSDCLFPQFSLWETSGCSVVSFFLRSIRRSPLSFKPLPCFLQWPQAWNYFSSLLKSALSGILQSSWSLKPASPLGQKHVPLHLGWRGRQLPISPWVTYSTSGHDWGAVKRLVFLFAPPWEEPWHCELRWGFGELKPRILPLLYSNRAFITQSHRRDEILFACSWQGETIVTDLA